MHLERNTSEHMLVMCLFFSSIMLQEKDQRGMMCHEQLQCFCSMNPLGSVGWRDVFIFREDSGSARWLPLPL